MIQRFIFPALLLIFLGCSNEQPDSETSTELPGSFFDLSGFIEAERERLNAENISITKKVSVGEKSEEKQLEAADFTKDLELFRRAGINKPAWVDKYRIEAAGNDTTYIATDSSLQTQLLQVLRDENNQVERIEIKRSSGNVLSSGLQELTYRPAFGYRIYAQQISDLVGSAEVRVEVTFNE
jgi:hypothetical protein